MSEVPAPPSPQATAPDLPAMADGAHGGAGNALPGGWDCHVHVFDAAQPVRPGHYQPVHRPLPQIEALAAQHGVGHLVLVQPSVYGCDNTLMLRALQAGGGRHRGVAVVAPDVGDAALDQLHAAGVRGVRFNCVSPAGHGAAPQALAAELQHLAPRLRARGWHVQWYVTADTLPMLPRWQADTGLCFVLDHLAGLHAGLADEHPAWAAAQALAEGGAWLKLSGWYRLGAAAAGPAQPVAPAQPEAPVPPSTAPHAPYALLWPAIRRAAALFGPRLVWGSDWPHTSFAPDRLPAYAAVLDPLRAALGPLAAHRVLHQGAAALYR
ncbi:amidohydrolase family protein [Aquabacterium sp. OR-4]|uniref:amidohydrolase family protein n=1 Tax=Aquabacterium sp. OR-4 TaxID=2978127 RepID=UPI0028CAD0F1|nr:amidohydrolase family protein [Aquabacterium sp. OR-4]MDT7838655.1 amidohydrolase family protein [Aquabacterium sp. OR-4]